jgi:ATP-binding cassette subfamily B protein
VGGAHAISILTGILGVLQTYLSNIVGQRVMHDLRARVYRHRQRLSLAVFTRTRTGEVQRESGSNDIGGVQNVVTTRRRRSSPTSRPSWRTVGDGLLDWRLALFCSRCCRSSSG